MGAKIQYPTGFLDGIDALENGFPEIAEAALEAAGEVILPVMKQKLSDAMVGDPAQSEMVASLGVSPVKITRDGNYNIKVGFVEARGDGEINAKLANIIEYGSKERNRPARAFLKPTKNASKNDATKAMKETAEKAMFEIWKREYISSKGANWLDGFVPFNDWKKGRK